MRAGGDGPITSYQNLHNPALIFVQDSSISHPMLKVSVWNLLKSVDQAKAVFWLRTLNKLHIIVQIYNLYPQNCVTYWGEQVFIFVYTK